MTRVTIIGEGPTEDYALPALIAAIRKWRGLSQVVPRPYTKMKTRGCGMLNRGALGAAIAICRKTPYYKFDKLVLHCDCDETPRHEQQHLTRKQIANGVVPTWPTGRPCSRCRSCYLKAVDSVAVTVVPVEATEAWEYVLAGQAGNGRGVEDLERHVVYQKMFDSRGVDRSRRAKWARDTFPTVLGDPLIAGRLDDLHRTSYSFKAFVAEVICWP